MKIATYNVWNESSNLELRKEQLIQEICAVDVDIIGFQEMPGDLYETFAERLEYPYHVYEQYTGEDEGLAIFSKYPIRESYFLHTHEEHGFSNALSTVLDVEGKAVSVTNVHLPWDSALQKEKQICTIDKYLHEKYMKNGWDFGEASAETEVDFLVLLGDFNGGLDSSVHRYLIGEQSLNGCEANPYWDELATGYQALSGEAMKLTLDLIHNPRWKGERSAFPSKVMDRIYTIEYRCGMDLEKVSLFGTAVSAETGWAASDHYGVVAEVVLEK